MSRRLERHDVWMLITTVVLVAAILSLAFPRTAEAQESQEAPEQTRVAAEPGDSLWSLAQQQVQPDATPEQIGNEVEQIFELNRERIGDDPNLILAGQELLLPPKAGTEVPGPSETEPSETEPLETEPSETEPSGSERGAPGQADEPSALPDLLGLPVAEPVPVVGKVRVSPESQYEGRRMLGFGLLVLSVAGGLLAVGILAAQNLPKLRRESHRRYLYRASYAFPKDPGSYENPSSLVPKSLALAHGPHRPEHADLQEEKEPPPPVSIPREDVPETLDEEENREPLLGPRDEPGTRTPRAASLRYAWLAGDFEPYSERSEDAPLEDKKHALGERR
jgi:hypothetical protein